MSTTCWIAVGVVGTLILHLIPFHFSFFVFSHLSMPNKARYFSTYASDVNANGPTAASMSGHSGFAVPICPMNSATISIPP